MPASIHPYKGYLNTSFRIYVTGNNPICYKVFNKAIKNHDISVCQGTVFPNEPHVIKMPSAGVFEIQFDNGTQNEIYVEDGYKYGGNQIKSAFVFDNCPWAFVIMHDRTYFYNRDNGESYVEVISPDNILEVSKDYVIFENKNQDDVVTLYSLFDQKPILWIKNVVFYNREVLCWSDQHEEDSKRQILYVFSLEQKKIIHRIVYESYIFDNENRYLYYQLSKSIYKLGLLSNSQPICESQNKNRFVSFFKKHYAAFYSHDYKSLLIYDVSNSQKIGIIPFEGKLARINDKVIYNVCSKYQSIQHFDFNSIELPEVTISCTYSELDIYPCNWGKLLYTVKTTNISSYKGLYNNIAKKEDTVFLKSLESGFIQELQDIQGEVCISDRFFLFYNAKESIVIPFDYPHRTKYRNKGTVYKFNSSYILQCEKECHILNRFGFWENKNQYNGDLDFSKFELYGVIIERKDKWSYLFNGIKLGKHIYTSEKQPINYLLIGNYHVYEGGGVITIAEGCPQYLSSKNKYGLFIDKSGVFWGFVDRERKFNKQMILKDIYDTSEYTNVLLDESGKQVLCRDNNVSIILDLATGKKTEFKNLSYINHINGIRPFVRIIETSQAILINPIDGQPIDYKLLTEYRFISPDNQLYADKTLEKYVEYYNLISGKLISKEDYLQLSSNYVYPYKANDEEKNTIKQKRLSLIKKHYDCIYKRIKEKCPAYEKVSKENIIETLLSECFKDCEFVDLFVEKRGVAVIKRVADDSEVARISLGQQLKYLNYVTFSKNSNYVAIAGRYPKESNKWGLFLVYDLINKKVVAKETNSYAVWSVAFNTNDAIAAYTSEPTIFFATHVNDYMNAASGDNRIEHYSFLTFSPDGKYFACSQQGYIPYRKQNGKIRENWGHQPSSLVSIRRSQNPFVEILAFNDLSEMGIADTMQRESVASASFSNDNSRIMMVGNDGTVIVRNIHFKEIEEIDGSHDKHNEDLEHDTYGVSYGEYAGTYAQDVMGFCDDVINDAFEGDPDACFNID